MEWLGKLLYSVVLSVVSFLVWVVYPLVMVTAAAWLINNYVWK